MEEWDCVSNQQHILLTRVAVVRCYQLASLGCSQQGCLLMGISAIGSKPDLFPDKSMFCTIRSRGFLHAWFIHLYQFHSFVWGSAEFKVTHLMDTFMILWFFCLKAVMTPERFAFQKKKKNANVKFWHTKMKTWASINADERRVPSTSN